MTWTADGVSIDRAPTDKRRMRVMVAYTNGTDSESRAHDVTSDSELTAVVAAQLADYERADAFLAAFAPGAVTIPDPPAPPIDPNAGLVPLSMEAFIGTIDAPGVLSKATVSRLRELGFLDAIRRDVLNQDRDSLRHWITLLNARDVNDPASVPVIPDDEARMVLGALQAKAS